MASSHTLRSFDTALGAITAQFERMGELVTDNCAIAARAYQDGDSNLALQVVNRDLDIDEIFETVRGDCFDMLLRFQPLASDLRLVIGIEHSVGDLERAGDHAKSIAKRVISNPTSKPNEAQMKNLQELARHVADSLRHAVQAMIGRNSEDARRVIAEDAMIDARNEAIFDAAMVELRSGSPDANGLVQQLFVSKALERVGDHATNIAEEVLFLTRGVPPGATRIPGQVV